MASRRGERGQWLLFAVLTVAFGVLSQLLALAINASSSKVRWPGFLDLIRRYPFPSAGLLTCLVAIGGILIAWVQQMPQGHRGDPRSPPVPTRPEWVVERPGQLDAVVRALRQPRGGSGAVGITTGLYGAGGFGKTTLSLLVCLDRRVRRRFHGRIYQVTMGRDVYGPTAIAAKVNSLTKFITGEDQSFEDPRSGRAAPGARPG